MLYWGVSNVHVGIVSVFVGLPFFYLNTPCIVISDSCNYHDNQLYIILTCYIALGANKENTVNI